MRDVIRKILLVICIVTFLVSGGMLAKYFYVNHQAEKQFETLKVDFSIKDLGTTHADYFHEAIPCTDDMTEEEVKGAYELETGNVIVKRFQGMNPVHTPGVLVKNHGPFSWGKDAHDAVHNAVVMEQVAKMASIAFAVNPNLTMNPLLVEKHFNRKHGPNAYYGQKK